MKYDTNFAVAIDFDNTITINSTYEKTGTLNPVAAEYIKKLKEIGCKLILWTCREGQDLDEAINLIHEWNLPFDYINEYPLRGNSKKVNVDFYIDDKSYIEPICWQEILQYIKNKINISIPKLEE